MKEKYETSSDDHTKCIKMQVVAILKMNRIGFQLPRTTETVSQSFLRCTYPEKTIFCLAGGSLLLQIGLSSKNVPEMRERSQRDVSAIASSLNMTQLFLTDVAGLDRGDPTNFFLSFLSFT